jgi:hypothetical protein
MSITTVLPTSSPPNNKTTVSSKVFRLLEILATHDPTSSKTRTWSNLSTPKDPGHDSVLQTETWEL